MSDNLDEIRTSIERLLPPDVVTILREEGIALTLSPSVDPGPIVTISDELAERELLGDMVSYREKKTGISHTIFISQKGYARHDARIKVAINPPHNINVTSEHASVSITTGKVVKGKVPPALLKQIQKFVDLNRDVLLDYWNAKISTDELHEQLKSI
jgi:hypothetical protein